MARKKSTDDNFFAEIAKKTGGLTLDSAGQVPYFINTGNLALNYICSEKFIDGGIPGGRITEVYGPPATSKSLLGFCCLASCQRMGGIAILLDCERAGSADFAERAGHVNTAQLITYEPEHFGELENKIKGAVLAIRAKFGPDKPILFVWDSIGVVMTKREWNEVGLGENPTQAEIKKAGGKQSPGERAKASGDVLRRLNPFLNTNNASLFVINQTRNKIGVMYGSPETTAGGGEALKFYASCRLRTSIGKMIENKTGLPLGVNLKFKNKKSRSCVPGIGTEGVQLFFKNGINPLGGMMTLLLAAERIELAGKGQYRVKEPWADGKDIVFNVAISKTNDVPLDVLLAAPKMIDAKDEDEVKDYLKIFEGAISVATGDQIIEKEVKDADGDDESDIVANLEKELGLDE